MFKRVILGILLLVLIAVIGLFVLAWHPAIDPIPPPDAAQFDAATIEHGRVLASAGYCASCHTAQGGASLAGGYAMKTDFGTIHSTNITPDPDTGIGRWSQAAFARSMREGIARDGTELFPAFPFDHFTRLTDADIGALYAYLMTQPPVQSPARRNELPFPFNLRALQAGWKLLYLDKGAYTAAAGESDVWNRGAYLAKGIGHCGACHTPRNALGAEDPDRRYAGALIDGWQAPPLDASNAAPLDWSVDELTSYLGTGGTALHGVASGPMSAVVHGLGELPAADIHAMAVYFADINGSASNADALAGADPTISAALAANAQHETGADLYRAACASCHYNSDMPPALLRPELALNSALHDADPTNLIHAIIHGVGIDDGIPGTMMPPFGASLGNDEIEALANYLRAELTDQPAWTDMPARIASVRDGGAGP